MLKHTILKQAISRNSTLISIRTSAKSFAVGDPVWLSVPTAGKLDPRWEGKWIIQSIVSPTTYTVHDGLRTRTVHINRLRQRLQAATSTIPTPLPLPQEDWAPPSVEHHCVTDDHQCPAPHYTTRDRRQPDYYQP